ncbi:hypothetical protein NDU88_006525 [Pleurodeles waltl]|uniref:Uncharacterized protein n=1 Tax=Pleurodeles waltl TaxID=8319 RepID=A0AAV7TXE6_PLEWA|nr:hypothetical protein NDU88_006525 [Pleurodeles waltl]
MEGGALDSNEETGRTDERGGDRERETDGDERGIGRYAPLKSNDLKGRREGSSEEVKGPNCHEDEDRPEQERRKETNEKTSHAPGGAWLQQIQKHVGGSTINLK